VGNENELKISDESDRDRETQRGEKRSGKEDEGKGKVEGKENTGEKATPIFAPVALVVQRYK
jgi:hypothetical protein